MLTPEMFLTVLGVCVCLMAILGVAIAYFVVGSVAVVKGKEVVGAIHYKTEQQRYRLLELKRNNEKTVN